MAKGGTVYILTNKHKTTLYVGVTSNIKSRLREHLEKKYSNSFSARYNLSCLVYMEHYSSIDEAIEREKQLKKKKRANKDKLISEQNPMWEDLAAEVLSW
jgi:putative endonuclease